MAPIFEIVICMFLVLVVGDRCSSATTQTQCLQLGTNFALGNGACVWCVRLGVGSCIEPSWSGRFNCPCNNNPSCFPLYECPAGSSSAACGSSCFLPSFTASCPAYTGGGGGGGGGPSQFTMQYYSDQFCNNVLSLPNFPYTFPSSTCVNDQVVASRSFLIESVASSATSYRLRIYGSYNCAGSPVSDETPALCSCQSNGPNSYIRISAQGSSCSAPTTLPPTTPPVIYGDLNGDGRVNTADLQAVLRKFGPCSQCAEDLFPDGTVNSLDLVTLIDRWRV